MIGDDSIGKMVRVVYLIPGVDQKPKEFIAKLLNIDEHAAKERTYVFSGRPEYGTTEVPAQYVRECGSPTRVAVPNIPTSTAAKRGCCN